MIFMAFFTRLEARLWTLLKRSKVQLPPTGGSVGPRKRAKVQGPTHPSERVGWTFQTVQGPCGGGPVRWGGGLQSDARIKKTERNIQPFYMLAVSFCCYCKIPHASLLVHYKARPDEGK